MNIPLFCAHIIRKSAIGQYLTTRMFTPTHQQEDVYDFWSYGGCTVAVSSIPYVTECEGHADSISPSEPGEPSLITPTNPPPVPSSPHMTSPQCNNGRTRAQRLAEAEEVRFESYAPHASFHGMRH
eukprot:1652274-Pyramimonas_sp.AAC.1